MAAKGKSKREKLAATIRALLAKTVANGCTEGEAVAAAAKAAEMLADNQLTEDEVRLREEGLERRDRPVSDVVGQHLWKVASAVAALCEVEYWTEGSGGRASTGLSFYGFSCDVEVADYLLSVSERAMRDAADAFSRGQALMRESVRRRRLLSFVDGMADRLRERIKEIAWTRRGKAGPGTGLVVLKKEIVRQGLRDEGIDLGSSRDRFSQAGLDNYLEGRAAADGVALDNAVGGRPASAGAIGTS